MQLMPETARRLGAYDPFNPEQNIAAGTRYTTTLMWEFHGDLCAHGHHQPGYTWPVVFAGAWHAWSSHFDQMESMKALYFTCDLRLMNNSVNVS